MTAPQLHEPSTVRMQSALGPGFKSPPETVIAKGVENIIDGMKKNGVKRLVQISTASTPDHNDGAGKLKVVNLVASLLAKNFYNDVTAAAKAIRESGLDWTIVRVPRLYDGPPTAQLRVGYYGRNSLRMKLSRGNLAKFVFKQLTDFTHRHKAPGISD